MKKTRYQEIETLLKEKIQHSILKVGDYLPSENELKANSLHFERLRCVGIDPVMLENNWFADLELKNFIGLKFVEDSFFKTLSQKYLIEITGSEQELRAEYADERTTGYLKIEPGAPILHISVKFHTNKPNLHIYSELYCNTMKYPIGNSYHL